MEMPMGPFVRLLILFAVLTLPILATRMVAALGARPGGGAAPMAVPPDPSLRLRS